ncbi:hypothetical protein CALVIDRAFT_83203 [Calocera viscosa TUFC12733]|uniref:Uncharacterized protein n=1 Tax=Calocera viscosa (strain TUFC12733) TaxID=1330018 RepID=A0A167N3X9_CALVF|nr:hypothetical protein CALVIDRAFT_83203 [Calocera viscosa TUFC12733]
MVVPSPSAINDNETRCTLCPSSLTQQTGRHIVNGYCEKRCASHGRAPSTGRNGRGRTSQEAHVKRLARAATRPPCPRPGEQSTSEWGERQSPCGSARDALYLLEWIAYAREVRCGHDGRESGTSALMLRAGAPLREGRRRPDHACAYSRPE